jgi:hypothetical protein
MTSRIRQAVALLCVSAFVTAAEASEGTENEWPCIQPRTGALSAGILWPRPIDTVPDIAAAADALVAPLALRRVTLDEAQAQVEAFAASDPDPGQVDALFKAVFDRINRDRDRVLAGITRYARSQITLAQRIDAAQAELARLTADKSQDFDRMDALEEQLAWDERIFHDRERALTYVCETPVLLEKRAFAVAQRLLPLVAE